MSTPANRRKEPSSISSETIALWSALVIIIVGVGMVWASLHLDALVSSGPQDVPRNPFSAVLWLVTGRISWSSGATVWAVLLAAALVFLVCGGWWLRRRRGRTRSRVDHAAAYLARTDDLAARTETGSMAAAQRLGVGDSPGIPIGRTVRGNQMLYGSWEDMHIDIWGPRTGKTTSRAIPAILTVPTRVPVVVTSNKRDVVDATRDIRAAAGPVWVFDPQQIALEEPTWWWNPLSYVTDEVNAAQLAEHFAVGSRKADAKSDAFFEPAGRDLLAGLLLAAALDGRPITDVYTWLTRPDDNTAVGVLADGGYPLQADMVSGAINAPDKQRAGIYGTATQMAQCLTNRHIAEWVTPQPGRREFHPTDFVRDGGTLYSLSKEGKGTAGPLVTALTVAVVDAAEELAARSPGGRLATPMLGVLDEVANVCRWAELPNMYSHYGSRGIVLMAILQSWSQGVEVWGREGMRKLWSAANVKVYGGGVSEAEFLGELSQLVGDYDMQTVSASHSRDGRSTTQQLRRETTLSVADLAAMPPGRALVLASGTPPTLIKTVPWMDGPHAESVHASLAAHTPANTTRDTRDEP